MLRRLLLILSLVLASAGAIFAAQPAAAEPLCPRWSDQQAMANTPAGSCRSTWLVDPGIGQLMGRAQLLQAASLYEANNFTRQWLWYAPIRTESFDNLSQRWVSCHTDVKTGAICAPSQVNFAPNSLIDNFTQRPLQLSVFSYGERRIPRVCGNFLVPENSQHNSEPVPTATIEKFDDRNRNGVRDAGEGGLAGWQFRVVRTDSTFDDQGHGLATTITTGPDGLAQLRFHGLGPGAYQIEEVGQEGWAPTTAAVQSIFVPDGAADAHLAHLRFGNAETRADLVKVGFSLADPPARFEAGQTHELTVRAEVRNEGPADVTARDTIAVSAPDDCRVEVPTPEVTRTLARGASAIIEFPVRVVCEDPSFHPITFTDHLFVETGGVTDPDPGDNTVAFEHVFPVFDDADIRLSGTGVSCPPRSDVNQEFLCSVTSSVSNAGPYGPVTTDVAFALTPPQDCTAAPLLGSHEQSVELAVDEVRSLTSTWQVSCAKRSFHPIGATAQATLNHLHVEDEVANSGPESAGTQIEIFEEADLELSTLDIRCTEREHNTTASACTATAVATNNGPATAVLTLVSLTITPEGDCTATPNSTQQQALTLDAGASATVTATWQLTCTGNTRHAARFLATVAANEPHAEDRDTTNNQLAALWGPGDVKPRSLPSSINIGKDGLVPFAVLSTATFDALTEVDRASLRIGLTGTEPSVVSCASGGEDVNGDGRLDLICHAKTQLLGLTCDTTVLRLTGRTTQGALFFSEDTVKIVGC